MATSSNEFAALVNQLHRSPNDHVLQQAVIQHLPKMIALARDNPMALYHLAHIYPPTSSEYKQTMRQAANLKCTNAMLVMVQILGNSHDAKDLQTATYYFNMINKSNDSYIKEQARLLLDEYPELSKTIHDQGKPNVSYSQARFFAHQRKKEEPVEFIETAACKA